MAVALQLTVQSLSLRHNSTVKTGSPHIHGPTRKVECRIDVAYRSGSQTELSLLGLLTSDTVPVMMQKAGFPADRGCLL